MNGCVNLNNFLFLYPIKRLRNQEMLLVITFRPYPLLGDSGIARWVSQRSVEADCVW